MVPGKGNNADHFGCLGLQHFAAHSSVLRAKSERKERCQTLTVSILVKQGKRLPELCNLLIVELGSFYHTVGRLEIRGFALSSNLKRQFWR